MRRCRWPMPPWHDNDNSGAQGASGRVLEVLWRCSGCRPFLNPRACANFTIVAYHIWCWFIRVPYSRHSWATNMPRNSVCKNILNQLDNTTLTIVTARLENVRRGMEDSSPSPVSPRPPSSLRHHWSHWSCWSHQILSPAPLMTLWLNKMLNMPGA